MTTSTSNYQTPQNNPYASASLYVGDLSPETTEATLFELFNAVGPVASIRVCRDAITRKSLGYAYVNFHSVADADRALDTMNFTNIKGRQCRIMWSQRDPSIRKSGKGNVFVKNLAEEIDNKTLYDTFSVFGSILSCKIVTTSEGKSRGYGYVHYVRPEDAVKAISGVNGMVIQDKTVKAELFKSREERQKLLKFTNVYVKYIPMAVNEEEFFNLITEIFANDESIENPNEVITSKVFWSREYGKSACINFATSELAELGVQKINGYDVSRFLTENESKTEEENKTIKTTLFAARCQKRRDRDRLVKKGKYGKRGGYRSQHNGINLYVKNLHPDIDDKKLEDMFAAYGAISSARVMKDHTGKSRGFGFVSFRKKEEATKAMYEMNSKVFNEKPLYVSKAQKKEQRRQFLAKQRNRIQQQQPPFGQQMTGYPQTGFPQRMPGYPPFPFSNMQPQGINIGRQPFPPMMRQLPYPPNPMQTQHMLFGQQRFQPPIHHLPQHNAPFNILPHQPSQQPSQPRQPTSSNIIGSSVRQPLSGSMHNQNLTSVPGTASHPTGYGTTTNVNVTHPAPQLGGTSATNIQQPQQVPVTSRSNQPTTSVTISSHPNQQTSITQLQSGGNQQPVVSSQPQGPAQSVGSSAPMREQQPLTHEMLANADPAERKRLIGERLFPKIQEVEPRLAGKITGMLLEMENTELLILLQSKEALVKKINEALGVLRDHRLRQSQKNQSSRNEGSQKNLSQKNSSQKNLSQTNN